MLPPHSAEAQAEPLPRTAPHAMADLGADLLESLSEAAAAIPANKNRKEGDAFCLNITPDVGAFVFGFSVEGSGVVRQAVPAAVHNSIVDDAEEDPAEAHTPTHATFTPMHAHALSRTRTHVPEGRAL